MRQIKTREELNTIIEAILKIRSDASDETAVLAKEIYPMWQPNSEYNVGDRLYYNNRLYRVLQGHTSQDIYPPSINTASLYVEITLKEGTLNNPIGYNNNMELEEGKYYIQNEIIYYCFRSTETPVYNNLNDLLNIYVELVN